MRIASPTPALVLLASLLTTSLTSAQEAWPRWRGPDGTGSSSTATPPVEWSADKNIRWKAEIPGRGNGTPIVWGDHVFVLTAVPLAKEEGAGDDAGDGEAGGGEQQSFALQEGRGQGRPGGERQGGRGGRQGRGGGRGLQPDTEHEFRVVAVNRKDGSTAWSTVATTALPHEGTHPDGTWASASALTDGERLYAFFGSRGLFAFDMKGKKLWEKQFGQMQTRRSFGEGASPALYKDTIVVQWDHEGPSFIVALNAKTGKELWRQERDEPTSWATPVIVEVEGKPQVITNGTTVRSYDLKSGKVLWEHGGMTVNAIPSPVLHPAGIAILMTGFRGSQALAVSLKDAKGNLSDSDAVLWLRKSDTPYVPSPLLYENTVVFYKGNTGILTALDCMTGEELFGPERLQTVANVYASPVAAQGRMYLASRDGEVEVRKVGGDFEVLATNVLEDSFDASPALVGDEIYLRGKQHLYCIAEE